MMSDTAQLIGAMARGDRAALTKLYNQTNSKLFGILMRFLRNPTDAEDALQNVYIKAWRNAPKFDTSRNGDAWLVSIARNHAVDVLRSRRHYEPVEGEAEELADGMISTGERMLLRQDLGRCFKLLPRDHAALILDVYMTGLSYQEAAEKTGTPLNTVRTWLRRGLVTLRECLGGSDAD